MWYVSTYLHVLCFINRFLHYKIRFVVCKNSQIIIKVYLRNFNFQFL